MEKPLPLEAEYPSHHPRKQFVVPDEEFLSPWSQGSTISSTSNSLGEDDEEDYYYKDDTPVEHDQGLGRWLFLPR